MPVRIVQSKQNARLKELRRALAWPGRDPGAWLAIEGQTWSRKHWRAGLRIECVFVAQNAERMLDSMALPPHTEVLLVPHELLVSALDTERHKRLPRFIQPPHWAWKQVLGGKQHRAALVSCWPDAGSGQPGHDRAPLKPSAPPASSASRHRSAPGTQKSGTGVGWQRLSRAVACGRREECFRPPARMWRKNLRPLRCARLPPSTSDLSGP